MRKQNQKKKSEQLHFKKAHKKCCKRVLAQAGVVVVVVLIVEVAINGRLTGITVRGWLLRLARGVRRMSWGPARSIACRHVVAALLTSSLRTTQAPPQTKQPPSLSLVHLFGTALGLCRSVCGRLSCSMLCSNSQLAFSSFPSSSLRAVPLQCALTEAGSETCRVCRLFVICTPLSHVCLCFPCFSSFSGLLLSLYGPATAFLLSCPLPSTPYTPPPLLDSGSARATAAAAATAPVPPPSLPLGALLLAAPNGAPFPPRSARLFSVSEDVEHVFKPGSVREQLPSTRGSCERLRLCAVRSHSGHASDAGWRCGEWRNPWRSPPT